MELYILYIYIYTYTNVLYMYCVYITMSPATIDVGDLNTMSSDFKVKHHILKRRQTCTSAPEWILASGSTCLGSMFFRSSTEGGGFGSFQNVHRSACFPDFLRQEGRCFPWPGSLPVNAAPPLPPATWRRKGDRPRETGPAARATIPPTSQQFLYIGTIDMLPKSIKSSKGAFGRVCKTVWNVSDTWHQRRDEQSC